MIKNTLIIALVIVIIYLYYQQKKTNFLTGTSESGDELLQTKQAPNTLVSFLKENLNSNNLEELKTKLGAKTLNELLEENEDYETEVDTLTRSKNSLEQDLLAQSNAFQSRLREKDREIKKLKEDLGSEKSQLKGSLERINKLTEQIQTLEKKMPGQFPQENLTKQHQEQLREIYALFDLRARGMKEIDFNQLMNMLKETKKKVDKK